MSAAGARSGFNQIETVRSNVDNDGIRTRDILGNKLI